MPHYISLLPIIVHSLTWNKARVKCFTKLVHSFIRNRSVNLTFAATSMTNNTKRSSEYRKAQRFFEKFNMPITDIGKFIISRFSMPKGGWTLAMDRTNWKFGATHINLLVVGVVIKGMSIPICWMALPQKNKRGNSNTNQRIEIMQQVLSIIPATKIDVMTMDREFTGGRWLEWLDDQGVGFIVRIKKSHKLNGVGAQEYRALPYSQRTPKVSIWGLDLYFGSKSINRGRDPYLFVVSNKYESAKALRMYKKRWSIELLFSHLKKRGFNLEDTHMTDPRKLESLFGVVTMSFFITYGWGECLASATELNASEKKKSIFRLGLESLLEIFSSAKPSMPVESQTIDESPPPVSWCHKTLDLELNNCLSG